MPESVIWPLIHLGLFGAVATVAVLFRPSGGGRHKSRWKIPINAWRLDSRSMKAGALRSTAKFIPTGTIMRVTVTNAIFSYNLATPVVAELDEAQGSLFPVKTRLLGRALVIKSHDRVNIEFDTAVLPDGREMALSAIALSPDGSAGIRGKVEKHKDSAVASSALKGAIV